MNRDTTIKEIQIKLGYPTADDILLKVKNPVAKKIPLGEINYEDLGGYKRYHFACKLYWERKFSELPYERLGEIHGVSSAHVKQLCKEFDKEVNKPIHFYEEKISRN